MDDADGADAAAAPAAKQKRGVSGLPRGVSKTKAPGRWQARVTVKVNGASKQRSAGSYASVEEAAQTVIEYEAVLAAGGDPWTEPARVNKHKRGEVCLPERVALTAVCSLTRCACSAQAPRNEDGSRFCERKTDRRWKKNKGASTAAEEAENQAENERDPTLPTSVPLPNAVEEITDPVMAALFTEGAPTGPTPTEGEGAVTEAVQTLGLGLH